MNQEGVRLIQDAINANSIIPTRITADRISTVPTYGYGVPQEYGYETAKLRSLVDEQRYQLLQLQSQVSAVQGQLLREVEARRELEKVLSTLVETLYGDVDKDQ